MAFQFDASELSRLGNDLRKMGRGVNKDIAKDNATMKAAFDSEHDKPVEEVLPVVRRMLANSHSFTFDEEMLTIVAECISDGTIPVIKRGAGGSVTLGASKE